jgi:hypothetical protein
LTPAARTAIRTWPGPGCGSGRSTISRTSGPPNWLKRTAFITRSDAPQGVLDGAFDLLVDDSVVVARAGDLLVVPPGVAHAFAAHRDSTAEALVIATPGIERFDYFRHVVRRREGSEPPEVLAGLQDRFDTHFLDSPAWQRARAAGSRSGQAARS